MHCPMNRVDVVNGAVGPFDDYCDGYGNPGSSGRRLHLGVEALDRDGG